MEPTLSQPDCEARSDLVTEAEGCGENVSVLKRCPGDQSHDQHTVSIMTV